MMVRGFARKPIKNARKTPANSRKRGAGDYAGDLPLKGKFTPAVNIPPSGR
jgi:hypothetical protein